MSSTLWSTSLPGRGIISFVSTVTFAFPGIALAVGFEQMLAGPLAYTLWMSFQDWTISSVAAPRRCK